MLSVTNLKGLSEPIPDYKSLEQSEEINGDFSLSVTIPNTKSNEHALPLIKEESIVSYNGHDFRIKSLSENRLNKSVKALHVFFDLYGHYKYDIYGGTGEVGDFLNWILSGTGWTCETIGSIPYNFIPNFGEDNAISLIWKLCGTFDCEIEILPGKHIKIHRERGSDNDFQFRYRYNTKTLKTDINTSDLRTVIKGFGADGLEVTYVSPIATTVGEYHAEPIRDENILTSEEMLDKLKKELKDAPPTSIQLEASQIDANIKLGDKVWLIYEPLNLEYQTRVISLRKYPSRAPIITLGNVKASFRDAINNVKVDIKENEKRYRSYIRQTNDNINLKVEELQGKVTTSISEIDMKSDQIALSVTQVENDLKTNMASINIRADGISSKVSSVENDLQARMSAINQRADSIELSVTNVRNEVGSFQSSINILSDEINHKVSQTDYNGHSIVSMINQTASSIKISAQKIDLEGIVTIRDLETPGATIINGGNITTGYINADRVRGGVLSLNNGSSIRMESWGGYGNMVFSSGSFTFQDASEIDFSNIPIKNLQATAKFA